VNLDAVYWPEAEALVHLHKVTVFGAQTSASHGGKRPIAVIRVLIG